MTSKIMMQKFWQQLRHSEKGQALPIVFALLVLGGLTLIPSLGYVNTSLSGSKMLDEKTRGVYAADAGIEDTLWALVNGQPPPVTLSDNVNQMTVSLQTENRGEYTLYLGELIEPGEHFNYLDIDGQAEWDEGADAYKYTINITWQAEPGTPGIHLKEVGARIPIGYEYEPESAADFPSNLSTEEPSELLDGQEAYLLNWELDEPLPIISANDTVKTQIFYITGDGDLEGDYAWIVASREDVGAVGEITGTLYRITSTATRPGDGKTTAKILADIVIELGDIKIISWQIIN